jgi:methionyl-tRNA formyltransferase
VVNQSLTDLRDKIALAIPDGRLPMFDTIILLTGLVEQPVLKALLLGHNPRLTVIQVQTASEFSDIRPDVLQRARLIAFTTPVIVPAFILAQLGYGAYNFHPGPPEYPGWAPAHFALYDGATEFGVTAHVMVEKVDAGAIIQVDRFDIPAASSVVALEGMAYAHLGRMLWLLAKAMATQAEPLAELPISWGRRKNTRSGYAAICDIPLDISKEDLHRRLDIFGENHFGIAPTIKLHGVEFRAVRRELELRPGQHGSLPATAGAAG